MKLSGNTILITGATSGIGLALTKRLLQLDNTVIAVGRTIQPLQVLQGQYPRLFPFACDLADVTSVDELVLYVEGQHPSLNVLVNNAAIQYNYHFLEATDIPTKVAYEVNLNLTVPIKLCALFLPLLHLQPEAAIVNVSSGLGLVPKQSAPVYCSTKAALHLFTKSLRYQLQSATVKVFEIIPPLVDTSMTAGRGKNKMSPEQLVEEWVDAFGKDHYEVNIGKVKWLRLINRLAPSLADSIMKNN